jgi:hypothetical protein
MYYTFPAVCLEPGKADLSIEELDGALTVGFGPRLLEYADGRGWSGPLAGLAFPLYLFGRPSPDRFGNPGYVVEDDCVHIRWYLHGILVGPPTFRPEIRPLREGRLYSQQAMRGRPSNKA